MYDHLTDFDWAVLDFIKTWNQDHTYNPSVRDVMNGVDASSTSRIAYSLRILESAGLIIREPGIARTLRVVPEAERSRGEDDGH